VIHGDLKPANILLAREHDGGLRAVITDFGLARPVAGITTSAGSGMHGTPSFAAPELWKGANVSKASDLYALGVILYEMISGRRPFEGRSPGDEVPPPGKVAAGVPASWDAAIARCMAPGPQQRPASAEDVARMLDAPAWKLRWGVWAAAAIVPILALLFVVFRPAPSPAILALLDLDADGASAVFGRGVMVDLSRRLSALPGADSRKVRVIPVDDAATNDVRRAAQAAAVFGATHVLSGSIRRTGDRFQVDAAVVDAKTNQKLKELHAGYELAEIGALPGALASVAGAVFGIRSASADTVSQAAYPDYVLGLSLMKSDLDSLNQAIAALERAVQTDPASASTHAGLAEAEWRKWGQTQDPAWLARAEQSAAKAQARNPDSPETLLITGRLKVQRSAFADAAACFRRVTEISPGNP
jgi:TolB-like protein